jgi:hypothetical protein
MTLNEAKALLSTTKRSELRDHAFGDCEVYWEREGETAELGNEVAYGYFGGDGAQVTIGEAHFTHEEARQLRQCGSLGAVGRNDSTGPATYTEGQAMPALTLAGVLEELTTQPCRRCSECDGQDHHFSESGLTCPADGSDPHYECKHCPATAKVCDDCGGAIFPSWSSPLCRSCQTDFNAEEDTREPW